MPKIVIREIDNTTAGTRPYANFSVVVPGIAKENATCFDENGVYECNSREEFKTEVGLYAAVFINEAAKAPTLESDKGWPKALTEAEFDTVIQEGNLYVAKESTKDIGRLRDGSYEYELAYAESTYNFKPEEGEETGEEETELTLFAVITDEGKEASEANHYGNQIAWELLDLGYTVLYKKMETLDDLRSSDWWKPLKDKSLYDFRYVLSGCINGNTDVRDNLIDLAEFSNESTRTFDSIDPLSVGRGDCIALCDIDEDVYIGQTQAEAITNIKKDIKTLNNGSGSKYAAVFAPTVTYTLAADSNFGSNTKFPASFHYLACAAKSREKFAEWYANAGHTRGVSRYTIESVGCKFGEAAVNALSPRSATSEGIQIAVNPIIQLRGNYYIWGNRTAHKLDSDLVASHFLNIRQLCSTIKKQVYVACRELTFDPNSETLWSNFCNKLIPMLDRMENDQGISGYKIIKIANDRKAFLSAAIRITPIEAVEDFDISVYLEDSLGGTVATTEE